MEGTHRVRAVAEGEDEARAGAGLVRADLELAEGESAPVAWREGDCHQFPLLGPRETAIVRRCVEIFRKPSGTVDVAADPGGVEPHGFPMPPESPKRD